LAWRHAGPEKRGRRRHNGYGRLSTRTSDRGVRLCPQRPPDGGGPVRDEYCGSHRRDCGLPEVDLLSADWPRGLFVVDLAITASGSSPPHEIPSEMLD